MRILELAVLYALVGAGCAVAVAARRARFADALLVFVLWPLYGPFLLLREGAGGGADREVAFLVALRRAGQSPLGSLLPDEPTVRALGRRLRVAAGKVEEIDALLARPALSEEAALRRQQELRARNASETAQSTAAMRLQNIRRLRALRDRFARELDEVGELLDQLTTQVEVVRLAGAPDAGAEEVVRELLARIEGLDEVLDERRPVLAST
jgi:hypothetical protein